MGLFDKIKQAAKNAAVAAQGALAGVNIKKAEEGDPVEQFKYGQALRTGKLTIKQDAAKAVEFFRKSVAQGNADAMNALGECLRDGTGTDADPAAAVEQFRTASGAGLAAAQTNLGRCLMAGTGCEKDEAGAVAEFGKAAEQGDAQAMFLLAEALWDGTGAPTDPDKATEWMVKAADADFADARPVAAIRLWRGEHVAQDREKAEALWTKAKKDPECAAYLAALAFVRSGAAGKADADIGDDVKSRLDFVAAWAGEGDADAQYAAARLLAADEGRAAESADWMKKAAAQGHAKASWAVVETMEDTEGALPERLKLLEAAAEGGIGPAAWELAQRYANATGVEQDEEKFWKYLPVAAEGDVADAQYVLAKAYDEGSGPYGQDESKRNSWLRRARKLGHAEAKEWIDSIEKAQADAAMAAIGGLVKKGIEMEKEHIMSGGSWGCKHSNSKGMTVTTAN